MATATLVAGDRDTRPELPSATVTDILWTAALPDDGLEHIHTQAIPGRLEITFFHRARSLATALDAAGRICRRALASSPVLREWQMDRPRSR